MIDIDALIAFASPFYANKDIMHDLSHIDRMLRSAKRLARHYPGTDMEAITYGCYFHGFVYLREDLIRDFLTEQGLDAGATDRIVKIAWESQKDEVPETFEGKLLHDAHLIEGGKTYLIVKSLCTGTARGQSLEQTLDYFDKHVRGQGECYLPEAKAVYAQMQAFAAEFIRDLREGLGDG